MLQRKKPFENIVTKGQNTGIAPFELHLKCCLLIPSVLTRQKLFLSGKGLIITYFHQCIFSNLKQTNEKIYITFV